MMASAIVRQEPNDISGAADDDTLVGLWLTSHRSPHTQRAYSQDARSLLAHMALAGVSLRTATVRHVIAWTRTLTGRPATLARRIGAAKSLFAYAARLRYMPYDLGAAVPVPKVPTQLAERIVDEATVRQLWEAARFPRNRTFIRFLYATGARISEACGVCWRHVHALVSGEGAVTLHGKGGTARTVLVPALVMGDLLALRGERNDDDAVFATRQGGAVTPGGMRGVLARLCVHAKIRPITPHWLRHAHASHALDHGAPVSLVQAQLGHVSLTTTGAYIHARPSDGSSRYLHFGDAEG